jgi:hypothetical protein
MRCPMARFISSLCLAFLFYNHCALAAYPADRPAMVHLDCRRDLRARPGQELEIPCRARNASGEEIYLLADDLSLEGPQRGKRYLFHPIGWERFENVLQFNFASRGLDLPTLFHPVAHLSFEQIGRLVALHKAGTLDVQVKWKLPLGSGYPAKGEWAAMVKLDYITNKKLQSVVENKSINSECRRRIGEAFSKRVEARKLVLGVRSPTYRPSWYYDGCRDKISEQFTHLYSDPLTIKID